MRHTSLALVLALALPAACRDRAPSQPGNAIPPPMMPSGTPTGQLPPGHPPMGGGQDPAGIGHPPMGGGAHPPMGGGAEPSQEQGGLTWTDPPAWRRERPASAMRRAQYSVPGPAGDGTLAVFYFGAGQGGDLDANLERWYAQFEQPDGGQTRATATRETRTVNNLRVTITTARGRFTGGGMPGGAPAAAQDDHALLGAIAETPQGPWFFKLTGPRASVEAARPAFDAMVATFRVP